MSLSWIPAPAFLPWSSPLSHLSPAEISQSLFHLTDSVSPVGKKTLSRFPVPSRYYDINICLTIQTSPKLQLVSTCLLTSPLGCLARIIN